MDHLGLESARFGKGRRRIYDGAESILSLSNKVGGFVDVKSSSRSGGREEALWSDLLWGKSPTPGCRCRYLVVIGPYPTKAFFTTFVARFNPKKVVVVIDEGWRDEELASVKKALAKVSHTIRFAGAGSGLVHAKLYYVEWEVKPGGNRRRRLLWGSANASKGGFGVNAEALSAAALPAASLETAAITEYFRQCEHNPAGTKVPEKLVRPVPGLQLVLPSFDIREDLKDISFDAWLQKGVLCHTFQPDPGFGSLTVKLKRPLPSSALVKYLSNQGATSDAKHDVWRLPFGTTKKVKKSKAKKAKRARMMWRRRYFVETWLGFWTSAECAAAAKQGALRDDKGKVVRFVAPGEKARRALVDAVAKLDKEAVGPEAKSYLDAHLKKLRRLFTGLSKKTKPGLYFETTKQGELDQEVYAERALKQLRGQRGKARTPGFGERYANGFELLNVPPLRGIGAGDGSDSFEEFALSLSQSLVIQANKRHKENRLLLSVAHALDPGKPPEKAIADDHERLLRLLRKRWPFYRQQVREFYR